MWGRVSEWMKEFHEQNAANLEKIPQTWIPAAIFATSALALYFELVMIRWHASTVHVFAIFKNVSLLSCFLGLGIGFALARRPRAIALGGFVPLLAGQILLFGLLASTIGGTKVNPVAEQLIMGLTSDRWNWLHPILGNLFLAGVFLLNATMFIPIGFTTGRLMTRLPVLSAYSWNLLGSLAGIATFFALSWAWSPPVVWFAVALMMACPFLMAPPRASVVMVASLTLGFLTLGLMGKLQERVFYSPYQVIALSLPRPGAQMAVPVVRVNHSFYQDILDCRPEAVARQPDLKTVVDYYDLPYRIQSTAKHVLIVGAGTGNDVAAALRNGAAAVTAVEIDPAIQYLGFSLHPERPYQDPRTRAVLNDARTYLRQTDEKFDTIVYGLLDSHTNLGAMTNVRLDSFVYTVEAFRDAVSRLTADGLLVVSYLTMDSSQADKLYAMLAAAYPDGPPRVLQTSKSYTFMAGPGLAHVDVTKSGLDAKDVSSRFQGRELSTDAATDDWPFFYMQRRTYPVTYAGMILLLLGLSVWMVKKHVGALHLTAPRNATFFFLGAGFMLVETKVITELGLTFGNTWMVIGIAITGVLTMAFLGNSWVSRRGPSHVPLCFALLGVALAAGWALSSSGVTLPLSKIITPVILVAPLLFAALIFSSVLASSDGLGDALAANLFGGMLGGFLEYNSMYWGLSSLYPLGFALYGLALASYAVHLLRQAKMPSTEAPSLKKVA